MSLEHIVLLLFYHEDDVAILLSFGLISFALEVVGLAVWSAGGNYYLQNLLLFDNFTASDSVPIDSDPARHAGVKFLQGELDVVYATLCLSDL